ncbi:MAG: hypothetical protein I8H98_12400 [Moraxellaceae bacterium]|uniref:Uncharacterized protein n=1 Tax=Acinetobacter tjernbergiae DSM 14971 = CIP 107465 TaxID=1120928 RepID=V2UTS0_9GAMM|nr:hypothetical protein [Acinetobacter tjernbergiae]ESK53387.1 hypothetical protein F990_03389 [Acinetobacter tjernbergiae DSM 14971 = CIP 107465]MBH2003043.1 hypothetical protein [Moraxellaceae bacterium]MBH2029255.1 hypothetical protein [Moraxellaceae bacterium]
MKKNQKIHILFSEKSNIAAVLRRGPTRWYHLMKWDLNTNEFIHGSWIKARIYEEKCDISFDGRYLLYSLHKGSLLGTDYTDSYTALSEIPSFTALALWPQGSTYLGGGRFLDKNLIGVYALPFMYPIHHSHKDVKGYELINLNWTIDRHKDENILLNADWSKQVSKNKQIAIFEYKIYIIENDKAVLFQDLTNLHPPK